MFPPLYMAIQLTFRAAMAVGTLIALGLNTLIEHLTKKYILAGNPDPDPEWRLYSSCIIGCCLPIGLFWFGWTSFPSQHWILPTMAIGCVTIGVYSIYLAVFNYIADTYHRYASSALAAQSFCMYSLLPPTRNSKLILNDEKAETC